MSGQELPRYFVPSQREPSGVATDTRIERCADSFRLQGAGAAARDVIVGVDGSGALTYACSPASESLSAHARRELSVHELSCASAQRAPSRVVMAEHLYLFEMQFLEQVASGQELNQPVYAYGTLLGPIAADAVAVRRRGQLALTRADLLEGFLLGEPYAFRYGSESGRTRTCQHALLPAARSEEIAVGQDLVLAYPLPPAELGEADLENAAIVQLLLAELVDALRKDVEREEETRGLLAQWFGTSRAAQLVGTETSALTRSFALARSALGCIAQWPSARAQALRARVAETPRSPALTPSARGRLPQAPPKSEQGTMSAPRAAPAPAVRAPLWTKPESSAPDWTRDFLPEQHRDDPSSRYLTWRPARAGQAKDAHWMDDFDAASARTEPTVATPAERTRAKAPEPGDQVTKPDWMRDFDDE